MKLEGYMSQQFGANANPSYSGAGLKGHTGEDCALGFGTPIHSPVNMTVYKVLTVDNPARDGSGFTGVFGIVDDGIESFEFLIGHCNPSVDVGQVVKIGDVIGTEANHGQVYGPNGQVTLAMQKAGSHDGSHRHYQKRPIMKVQHTQPGYTYLDCYSDMPAGYLYIDPAGNYYQIFNSNNGYNGCVDPVKSDFQRDLTVGSSGYDVYVLQRLMAQQGLFTAAPTAYFGPITQAAVGKFQDRLNIDPDVGYFGPRTRTAVINTWGL
jgi:murein DD-endopeptidase MepM/ murein hydrolase activator NlpD